MSGAPSRTPVKNTVLMVLACEAINALLGNKLTAVRTPDSLTCNANAPWKRLRENEQRANDNCLINTSLVAVFTMSIGPSPGAKWQNRKRACVDATGHCTNSLSSIICNSGSKSTSVRPLATMVYDTELETSNDLVALTVAPPALRAENSRTPLLNPLTYKGTDVRLYVTKRATGTFWSNKSSNTLLVPLKALKNEI